MIGLTLIIIFNFIKQMKYVVDWLLIINDSYDKYAVLIVLITSMIIIPKIITEINKFIFKNIISCL
jgi:hypothetical protein